jgi:hypothetical protein
MAQIAISHWLAMPPHTPGMRQILALSTALISNSLSQKRRDASRIEVGGVD